MAEAVRKEIGTIRKALPADVRIGSFYDQSILVGDAVGGVRDAVGIGAILSVVVLMLFLGNVRATVVTAAIIPITSSNRRRHRRGRGRLSEFGRFR